MRTALSGLPACAAITRRESAMICSKPGRVPAGEVAAESRNGAHFSENPSHANCGSPSNRTARTSLALPVIQNCNLRLVQTGMIIGIEEQEPSGAHQACGRFPTFLCLVATLRHFPT